MQNINASCKTKRGCNTNLDVCPSDGDVIIIHSEVYGAGNDIKALLPIFGVSLDQVEKEAEIKIAA